MRHKSIFFLKRIKFKSIIAVVLLEIMSAGVANSQNSNSSNVGDFIGNLKNDIKSTGNDIIDIIRYALYLGAIGIAVKKFIDVMNNRSSWIEFLSMFFGLLAVALFITWAAGFLK